MRRLTRSRRPWRRVAVLAVLVGILTAAVTPAVWDRLADPERLPWTIVGAGPDGRSLVVTATRTSKDCGAESRVHVERDDDTEIRLRVVASTPVRLADVLGADGESVCPLILLPPERFSVRLDHDLGGRRIGGPGYRPRLAGRRGPAFGSPAGAPLATGRRDPAARMVSVVGLRLDDARRVLRSAGVLEPSIDGVPAPDGAVIAQVPRAGVGLQHPAGSAHRGRRGVVHGNAARLFVRPRDR